MRVLPDSDHYTIETIRAVQDLLDCDNPAISADLSPLPVSASFDSVELSRIDAEAPFTLSFTNSELDKFVTQRIEGLRPKSQDWIKRASQALWESTKGEISLPSTTQLRTFALEKYRTDSHSKVLSFAKSFLKFLAKTKAEPSYQTFAPYLELPKTVKERKSVTSRIVTKEDICNILEYIKRAERAGKITSERAAQYSAFVLFGAYTGQRSEATIKKLTVGQFREAVAGEEPVLEVDSSQDKTHNSLYVPLPLAYWKPLNRCLFGEMMTN